MAKMVYDPESGKMISQYELYLKNKSANKALSSEIASGGIKDESGEIPKGVVESGQMSQEDFTEKSMGPGGANAGLDKQSSAGASPYKGSAAAAGQAAAGGGDLLGVTAAGLMAAPHPYAQAAGLGLLGMMAVNKQLQQNRQNRYNQEIARVKARQEAIDRLSQIGQGLKV